MNRKDFNVFNQKKIKPKSISRDEKVIAEGDPRRIRKHAFSPETRTAPLT